MTAVTVSLSRASGRAADINRASSAFCPSPRLRAPEMRFGDIRRRREGDEEGRVVSGVEPAGARKFRSASMVTLAAPQRSAAQIDRV